ncbi:MAG: SAM-dependent methyltransferase [Candidatus Cryptobacteroides sp.]|nr:SAM-dependent methyltransferase [Bacteroidales bacterium]MDY6158921.1 SAM-dependent methyltransferase [Candidatus Cryptobacteroides sp.]
MTSKGKLYLIPTPLGDNPVEEVIPKHVLETACSLRRFVVEQTRTARRFLSRYGLKGHVDELEFHELNEHSTDDEVRSLMSLFDGSDVGLLSEAGLPAVADPGARLVELCHLQGVEVVPLVGPSSLMMALMASGLNGQCFEFCGYIPAKADSRKAALRSLEKQSRAASRSEIIIETPYRNDALFADMLQNLSPDTRICVAADISLPTQYIRTARVAQWRKAPITIGKRPCVFIILA